MINKFLSFILDYHDYSFEIILKGKRDGKINHRQKYDTWKQQDYMDLDLRWHNIYIGKLFSVLSASNY